MMNMPEKKQDYLLKKLENKNSAMIHGDLCIPTPCMCDEVLYKEEANNFRSEGMHKKKEASRRSRKLSKKPKESGMFTNIKDHRDTRPSNLLR